MATKSLSGAIRAVVTSLLERAMPGASRDRVFNRLYVTAMFAVIIGTGGVGIFSLVQRQSNDHTEQSSAQAQTITELVTAVDREYTEFLWQLGQREDSPSARFVEASHAFDVAYASIWLDAAPASRAMLANVARRHAAFLSQSRRLLGATPGTEHARLLVKNVKANVEAIQQPLDAFQIVSYTSSVAEAGGEKQHSLRLEMLIAAATLLGLALMTGIAEQIRRLRRSAATSAAATVAALQRAALTDNLTGLGNNRSFYDDFEREAARAKRYGHALVLALIDVDDFKAVNDKGGHSHGDAVLSRIGELLRNTRREDRGYRIGGDEFAFILVETGPQAARVALDRLQSDIRESALGATVSIGYVNLVGAELHSESYELADTALYEAKRLGRNQTVCFEDVSGSASVFSPRKAEAVRTMIAQGLVSTAFQPIWDMQSTQPLGFEALARPLAELGLSGPQEAFDVAQRIRQLPELDTVCTRKALETAANLPPGAVLFLNYSPASLAHAGFDADAFVAVARAAQFLPEQIVIELTESRIDDPAAVVKGAAALRALGVRIALDDTGSGHAGLEIMSKMRFDFVKIDRLLVIDAMKNGEARGVLAGIIAIARENGSYLIAEGIETGEMLDFVKAMHLPSRDAVAGVRGVQGYLLGRPEVGGVDVGSLVEHHLFLAARRERTEVSPAQRSGRALALT
jgi:diguanylate cyclase (GGDEF)-like protein